MQSHCCIELHTIHLALSIDCFLNAKIKWPIKDRIGFSVCWLKCYFPLQRPCFLLWSISTYKPERLLLMSCHCHSFSYYGLTFFRIVGHWPVMPGILCNTYVNSHSRPIPRFKLTAHHWTQGQMHMQMSPVFNPPLYIRHSQYLRRSASLKTRCEWTFTDSENNTASWDGCPNVVLTMYWVFPVILIYVLQRFCHWTNERSYRVGGIQCWYSSLYYSLQGKVEAVAIMEHV